MARIVVCGSFAESLITFRGAMLKEMVAKGHQVYAFAPETRLEVKDALSRLGVKFQEVNLDRGGRNPFVDVKSLVGFIPLLKRIKPDIVLSYTIKPVIYGSLAAKLSGVPRIYSMITGLGYAFSNSDIKSKLIGSIAKLLYRSALKYNENVFFQNPDDIRLFLEKKVLKSANKAVLINGSGVDIHMYHQAPIPTSLSFLLIARLIKDKGIYEYAKAAHEIKKTYPSVKFKLVGFLDRYPNSVSERDLKSWIESGTIEYMGYLKDVRPAIENSTVYVLPSYYREGTPHSVLEAMAMGRPIITSDAPGCRETVQHGKNGFLVPVKNVDALVKAMMFFIERQDDIENMGQISREIAVEKYDVNKVNSIILNTMRMVEE